MWTDPEVEGLQVLIPWMFLIVWASMGNLICGARSPNKTAGLDEFPYHICMPRFLWRTVEFFKVFFFLFSPPLLEHLENSAVHFSNYISQAALNSKKHRDLLMDLVSEFGWRTMIAVFHVLPFCDTKSHRLLFPDTRRSITGLNEKVSFQSSWPHYYCRNKIKQNPESSASDINPGLIQDQEIR